MSPQSHDESSNSASVAARTNEYHPQIRLMCETDIDEMIAIEQITWPAYPWSREHILGALQDQRWTCWVLESNTNPKSMLGYGLQYILIEVTTVSHIANICIHPDRRGCGLGQILLRHMLAHARESGAMFVELEVHVENTCAYALYTKHRFSTVECLRKFYPDGSNAFRMQLLL